MKLVNMYEISTDNNIARDEEINTVVVNIMSGLKLKELFAKNDKIYFVFSEVKKEGCEEE